MEARTKHKLALGAAAGVVCLTAYAIISTQGDSAEAEPMTMGGGGIGGFGDFFRKLLGTGAGLGAGTGAGAGGLAPLDINLPLPPTGPEIEFGPVTTYDAPTNINPLNILKQSLIDLMLPPQPSGPTAEAAPITQQEAATAQPAIVQPDIVEQYSAPPPIVYGYNPAAPPDSPVYGYYDPTAPQNTNEIGQVMLYDHPMTQQDIVNIAAGQPNENVFLPGSPSEYYSQPGVVDANGQTWVGGSPPTT